MLDDESYAAKVNEDSWSWCRWAPTSMTALKEAEEKIFRYVQVPLRKWFAPIGKFIGREESFVRTVSANTKSRLAPLVLVHGFGAGVALWSLNLESLATARPVYAFDILGFGRSSRPHFSSKAADAEDELIESIEEWRKSVGLEKFILLGHSMGGYLAASYALKHPEQVQHLILADPWGFQKKDPERYKQIPVWIKVIGTLIQPFNPLAILRAAGPWGPGLVDRARPDIKAKFQEFVENDEQVISNYIYHCNAQNPSGETAFKSMMTGFGWAKNPMVNRMGDLNSQIPVSFIYGAETWMDKSAGEEVKKQPNLTVGIHVIEGAGHHVYADQAEEFNKLVQGICSEADGSNRL